MKILTTLFNYKDCHFNYKEMHRVFVESCKRHMPDIEVVTLNLYAPPAKDDRKPGIWTNTVKLRAQAEYIANADDDIVICDCDMLCVKSIEDVFNLDFDIGYTVKPLTKKTKSRINGGMLFIRNTEKAKQWMADLWSTNKKMYYDPEYHNLWRKKYFGMNQSAMGCLVETYRGAARVVPMPTVVWNAVDCDWSSVNANTRMIHIKGKLRRCIFSRMGYHWLSSIMREWYSYTGISNFEIVEKMPWDYKRILPVRHKKIRRSKTDVRNG